jgi:hypothetical protein
MTERAGRTSPREHRVRGDGNVFARNGPDDGARPRGRARRGVPGNRRRSRRANDEGARSAVNATIGDGRSGDATHGGPDFIRRPSLSAEGRLRRAAGATRGILFRDRRKRAEPQDRQRPANGRGVEEEQTVEVVGNHEDGTRMGTGIPIPKEDREALRDADSPAGTMEGQSLDNPTRGNPASSRVARTGTRRESRRQGQEGRARTDERSGARTGRRSSRTAARRRASRSRRAAVNGQGAATSIGFFSPQEATAGAEAWRGPRPGRPSSRARASKGASSMASARYRAGEDRSWSGSRSPAAQGRGGTERATRP